MYPTAEQFSDLFDSFFHKTEDKIPMSGVEGLTDQLNGKYNTAEGRELEKKVQKVTTDLSAHVASSEKAFNEVQNDIEALDGRLDDEIERAKDEEAATRVEARINYHLRNNKELQPLTVGCSLGFARWHKGMDATALYTLADQQLYRHKNSRA